MIILGIDPGYGRLGFAIVEKKLNEVSLKKAGVIETDKTADHENRLLQIHEGIEALAQEWKPKIISIEKIFFTSNQKTVIRVAEARGVALLTGALRKIKVYEYSPPEIKLAVTGSGRADKKAIGKMVSLLLKLRELPALDDATDAIALAITAAYDRRKIV
jgi:crossover junction endodeoxyribonuclease RuvC